MKTIAKKTIIVYVLKILYNYTSNNNPATQTFIANYLNDICNLLKLLLIHQILIYPI